MNGSRRSRLVNVTELSEWVRDSTDPDKEDCCC